jgi:hypothetical protein
MSQKKPGVETAIDGIRELRESLRKNPESWQNDTLEAYLEATEAWLEATKNRAPEVPSWEYVAGLFGVGRIYE